MNVNLLTFYSREKDVSMSLSVFNKRHSLTAFPISKKSKPLAKFLFNYSTTVLAKEYMRKVLKTKDAVKYSVSYLYRQEGEKKFGGKLTVGRDQEKRCFIHISDANNQSGVGVITILNEDIEVNDSKLSDIELSEIGMNYLISTLTDQVPIASLIDQEDVNGASIPSTSVGDDVPF